MRILIQLSATLMWSTCLWANTLLDVNFSHLIGQTSISDAQRIEDSSGNGFHGFWGQGNGTYPLRIVENQVVVDTSSSSSGHVFLRDGLDQIPDSWDGPQITISPYFEITGTKSYTFEAVINWNQSSSTVNGLMGQTGGAEFWIREQDGFLNYTFDDGVVALTQFGREVDISSAKQDGAWHSIAIVYDADVSEVRSYLDGVLIHTRSNPAIGSQARMTSGTSDFRLGAYNTTGSNAFNGLQARYRISEVALEPREMLPIPPAPATPTASGVQITGLSTRGETLVGSYNYIDAQGDLEGASELRWFRSRDTTWDSEDVEISGANSNNYVLQSADVGFYLFFQVTPVALSGPSPGTPIVSTPTARILAPGPFPESIPFTSGIGYPVYRIPAIVRANDGTLLAFCEGRAGISDGGNIDIVLRRSNDNGNTWQPMILVQEEGGTAPITIGNPAPVVDRSTGRVHLLFTRENDTVFHTFSDDTGLTWSERTEITERVKLPEWGWYATGPCHAIQLTRGAQAGRLVVPANHRIGANGSDSGSFGAQIIYSDDHGETWNMDVYADGANGTAPNETTLVELNTPGINGGSNIYINSRDYGSDPGNRSEAFSGDGGSSYTTPYDGNPHFVTPIVQGSLLRFSATDEGGSSNRIIFSCPNGGSRSNGALWISNDEAVSWSQPKPLFSDSPRDFAYSDLVKTQSGDLGVLYETDNYGSIRFIRVSEAWLDQDPPPISAPQPALWQFDEKPGGESVDDLPGSVLDKHPLGSGQHLSRDSNSLFYSESGQGSSRAIVFDGSGGLSRADSATSQAFDYGANDSVTFEACLRVPIDATLPAAIIAKNQQPGGEWWIRVQSGGTVTFLWDDGVSECSVTSSREIHDGNWHHVAAVRDANSNELRIYIDGLLDGSKADTTTGSIANTLPITVAAFNSTDTRNLIGSIDWLAITPSVLEPGSFVADRLALDADLDGIPDDYETRATGSLDQLGSGDFDQDGLSDWIEIALNMDPTKPTQLPILIEIESDGVDWSYQRRSDIPWLDYREEVSSNLLDWQHTPSTLTRSVEAIGTGIERVRLQQNDRVPTDRLFFRVKISSSFP